MTASDTYQVAYDITRSGYNNWWSSLIAIMIICLLGLELKYPFIPYTSPPFAQKTMRYVVFFVAVSVTTVGICNSIYSYWSVLKAIKEKQVSVVEGEVTKFRTRGTVDWFCIKDECFRYPASVTSVGFRQLSSEGGPIQDGQHVRVFYVGEIITRLEVAKR